METKTRLHPLLTVAAISLTVFSAIGIAALTGVLPHSRGSSEPVIAPEVQKPIEHAVTMPAPTSVAKPKPRRVAQAPKAVEAPKPAPLPGVGAVIESVQEIEQKGENPIAGPIIGGIARAVLGHQFGESPGETVSTAVGAAPQTGIRVDGDAVGDEEPHRVRHRAAGGAGALGVDYRIGADDQGVGEREQRGATVRVP